MLARVEQEESLELIISNESVLFVIKSSLQTNIQNKYFVLELVQTVIEQSTTKTYDITVADEHEFFANGILVSNCDSLRYSLEPARRSKASIIKY